MSALAALATLAPVAALAPVATLAPVAALAPVAVLGAPSVGPEAAPDAVAGPGFGGLARTSAPDEAEAAVCR